MDKKNPFLMGLFAPAEVGVMPNKSPAFQFYHPSPYFCNHYFFLLLQQLNGETISTPNHKKIKRPIDYGVMTVLSQAPLNK